MVEACLSALLRLLQSSASSVKPLSERNMAGDLELTWFRAVINFWDLKLHGRVRGCSERELDAEVGDFL
jgi:hypothetical protein